MRLRATDRLQPGLSPVRPGQGRWAAGHPKTRPRHVGSTLCVAGVSLGLTFLLRSDLPPSILLQILPGLPVLWLLLNYAIARTRRIGYPGIILTAPLLRQILYVTVPSVVLEATGESAAGFSQLDTITTGATILTLENCVAFIVLALVVPATHKREVGGAAPVVLSRAVPAILLILLSLVMQVSVRNAPDTQGPLGFSISQWWGPVGLALLTFWAFDARRRAAGRPLRIGVLGVVALTLALPFLGAGGRIQLLQPIAAVAVAYMVLDIGRLSARRVVALAALAFVVFAIVSAATQGVRRQYYLSGATASLAEVKSLAWEGGDDLRAVLLSPVRRFGCSMAAAQYISDTGLGTRSWGNLGGLVLASAVSSQLIDLAGIFGVSYAIDNLSPSAYLARLFGTTGGFALPLSADLYGVAGLWGPLAAGALIAGLTALWLRLLCRWYSEDSYLAALLAGQLYLAVLGAETGEQAIGALMWKLAVLATLLLVYERLLLTRRRRSSGITWRDQGAQ